MRADESHARRRAARTDSGAALVVVLLLGILGVGLGLVMLRVADVETWSAATERDGAEALHAADALLEFSIHELGQMADWTPALTGGARSGFLDASPRPVSVVAGLVDLVALTRALQADTNVRSTAGPDTPGWRLFASGPLERLAGSGGPVAGPYLITWIADDEAETDGDPGVDGNGSIRVRTEARGRRGARRVLDAVIARGGAAGVVRLVSWKEAR